MNTITFDKTSLWYDEVIALNEVSFSIRPGITGMVGSNGAGKTSSIKLAASLLRPTIGTVTVDGEDIWQNMSYLKRMGYSPEIDRQFGFMTGRKFLDLAGRLHSIPTRQRKKKIDDILEKVGMTHAADRRIDGYSRGMRQRIKVGQSLVHDPQILLADEPLSGTDPIGRNIMIRLFDELIKDEDSTIVVSSHVLHELERISQ
ncbi:MAG: ABC transporter ATP-binding protein, partial [Candidatus Kariarchaeaceae archaeon]